MDTVSKLVKTIGLSLPQFSWGKKNNSFMYINFLDLVYVYMRTASVTGEHSPTSNDQPSVRQPSTCSALVFMFIVDFLVTCAEGI